MENFLYTHYFYSILAGIKFSGFMHNLSGSYYRLLLGVMVYTVCTCMPYFRRPSLTSHICTTVTHTDQTIVYWLYTDNYASME